MTHLSYIDISEDIIDDTLWAHPSLYNTFLINIKVLDSSKYTP